MAEEHHSRRDKRLVRRLTIWLVGALVLCLWVYADFRVSVDSPLRMTEPTWLIVKKGQGVTALAHDLKTRHLLAEPLWFRVLALGQGASQDLKYGEYEIPRGTTVRGLLELLVSGRTRQLPVTIVEGWTFAQMREVLANHPNLRQETAGQPVEDLMARLGLPGQWPEGQFFPDTYFTSRHTSDLDIFKLAHAKMQSVLESEWPGRAPNLPYNSPYEALIMASIVEKETGRAEERPAIAGVFIRRLRQGMRLQTDPTVIYGLGESFQGNLRREDLRRDTPYNTYTRAGLPPTPIALPGRQAIHAALHPAEGTSLYFVARGDGTHVFSTTLDEHERAVDRFQRRR
ncbi:MAG: endolytic transglycosylase MltG [Chthoniobacteraceae bacterium]